MRKGSIDCFSYLAAEILEACILKWKNKSRSLRNSTLKMKAYGKVFSCILSRLCKMHTG